jgi:hypothetical protein
VVGHRSRVCLRNRQFIYAGRSGILLFFSPQGSQSEGWGAPPFRLNTAFNNNVLLLSLLLRV